MKLRKVLFNFITIGMLAYTMFALIYSVLPEQYQLEQFNTLTALVSGGSTGLIGSAGLLIKSLLVKNEKSTDEKQAETIKKFLDVLDYVKGLEQEIDTLKKDLHAQYTEQMDKVNRVVELVETDLKAKLSNKLIDQEIRELINGVLEDEEKVV